MTEALITRLAWQTNFSYGQIKAYMERVGSGVSDKDMAYNILEAAAMNLDIDLLGAPQPASEEFRGTTFR